MFPFTGADLHRRFETGMYPASLVITDDAALWLQRTTSGKQLAIIATSDHPWLAQFSGESQSFSDSYILSLCPANHANARALQTAPLLLPPSYATLLYGNTYQLLPSISTSTLVKLSVPSVPIITNRKWQK